MKAFSDEKVKTVKVRHASPNIEQPIKISQTISKIKLRKLLAIPLNTRNPAKKYVREESKKLKKRKTEKLLKQQRGTFLSQASLNST